MQDPASDPCSFLRPSLSLSIREQEGVQGWGLMICRLKHAWGPGQGWAGWQEALGPHEAVIKYPVVRLQRSAGSGYSHRARNEEGALRMPWPGCPDCTYFLAVIQSQPGLPGPGHASLGALPEAWSPYCLVWPQALP